MRVLSWLLLGCWLLVAPGVACASDRHSGDKHSTHARKARTPSEPQATPAPSAELRLIEIYRLIGQGQMRQALSAAESLAQDHPSFQLAQLVHGDLLAARTRPLKAMGDAPVASATAAQTLAELREESLLRLQGLREQPPVGHVPSQFLQLSERSRHAIAVDTSRARLYLFENSGQGLRLVTSYYVSVGKLGTGKQAEGDQRTPLGLYHITSQLDRAKLTDFYGAGALPINYPNPYDARRGKTGGGIWLHGTPPGQYARAPRATDGCVVLANPDLRHLLQTVQSRSTPVLIASQLQWVSPHAPRPAEVQAFVEALQAWRMAKTSGEVDRLLPHYSPDASASGKSLAQWLPTLQSEMARHKGRELELKDLSFLRWTDSSDTMVVTFGEVLRGARTGPIKRQYWMRSGAHWKIFFEGVIG